MLRTYRQKMVVFRIYIKRLVDVILFSLICYSGLSQRDLESGPELPSDKAYVSLPSWGQNSVFVVIE